MTFLSNTQVEKLILGQKHYPPALATINDPPKQIFVAGNLDLFNKNTLAVVGTRKCTAYGLAVTEKLVLEAAKNGIAITSGLARGIDAAAHKAALKAKGFTIAVLGHGISEENLYPPEHRKLAQEIMESGGLIISEYEAHIPPMKHQFIARNRIIAGLARAVLVTEAPAKSGALITASLALDYNREVLAVPGHITSPASEGPNKLIRDGAKPILEPQDILEVFGIEPKTVAKQKEIDFTPEQTAIINLLSETPLSISELLEKIKMDVPSLTKNLTELELCDKILSGMDGKYSVK